MRISPAVKVGLLTLLSLVILILGVMWLKGRAISAGERIEVKFQDVNGMRPGSPVQMMGIRIGQVEEIIPVVESNKSYVKVKFVITEPDITIPLASTISIQQSGLIGENFLEITPPQINWIYLPVGKSNYRLNPGAPVELLAEGKYMPVGQVKSEEIVDIKTLPLSVQEQIKTNYVYKIGYVITTPGFTVPDGSKGSIADIDSNHQKLKLTPPANILVQIPEEKEKYTVIEPIRFKEFFDIQLESASALKETNDKINQLLSDESIKDLKATLKNTKELTAKATITLDQANKLLISSQNDLNTLVGLATNLSDKMVVLSDNINKIAGDPKLKNDLLSLVNSMQRSSKQITNILEDSKLNDTLVSINDTSKNISEISDKLNTLSKDKDFSKKLDTTINNLNYSMDRLSKVLDNVNSLTTDQKSNLKDILNDSAETSKNLKKFSDKLNKRFLLFRLMF